MLEIDVDIGRLAARRADEALEEDVDAGGIDRGDAEAIAHHRIGRRTAALAEDRARAGEADDVVDGEEIAREIELLDQLQFVRDQLADVIGNTAGKLLGRAVPGQLREARLRRHALRHRLFRVFVAQFVEAEAAAPDDLDA